MKELTIFNQEQEESVLLVNIKETDNVIFHSARNRTFIAKDYGRLIFTTFVNTYLQSLGRVRNEIIIDIDRYRVTGLRAKVVGKFRLKQWKEGCPKTQ